MKATPSEVTDQGQDMVLECTYTVIPPAYELDFLAWDHDNIQIYSYDRSTNSDIVSPEYKQRLHSYTPTNQRSNLTLLSASLQDAGTYTCTIYSTEPNTERFTGSADVTQTGEISFQKFNI